MTAYYLNQPKNVRWASGTKVKLINMGVILSTQGLQEMRGEDGRDWDNRYLNPNQKSIKSLMETQQFLS